MKDMEELVHRLTTEFNYPYQGALVVAEKCNSLQAPVREAFDSWWASGELPELEIHGYTVEKLMKEHGMNPIAAFLTLDWIQRDPAKAVESLKRGHDRLTRP